MYCVYLLHSSPVLCLLSAKWFAFLSVVFAPYFCRFVYPFFCLSVCCRFGSRYSLLFQTMVISAVAAAVRRVWCSGGVSPGTRFLWCFVSLKFVRFMSPYVKYSNFQFSLVSITFCFRSCTLLLFSLRLFYPRLLNFVYCSSVVSVHGREGLAKIFSCSPCGAWRSEI